MGLIRQRAGIFANYPVLTATTAASGGVLLGAYVAMQIFAAPVPNEAKVPAAAPIADAKPQVKQVEKTAETTGVAPAKEDVAAADRCAGQTWPYLTRECTEQMQKNRPVRAVTADRVDKPGPEAPAASPTQSVATLPAPSAPAAPPPAEASSVPAPGVSAASNTGPSAPSEPATKPVEPTPPNPAVAAAPPASPPRATEPALKAQAPVAAFATANSQQDAAVAKESAPASKSVDKSAERRKIKQAKERARKQERDRQNLNEGDGPSFAGIERGRDVRERDDRGREVRQGDDRGREFRDRVDDERVDRADRRSLRAESRSDRPRRERVVEGRDNDGEDAVSERRGRRVIVIERDGGESPSARSRTSSPRDGGGGLFGGLFGGGLFGN